MKTIKAKKDFSLNGKIYLKGDDVKIKDIETINRLNEKGFIETLSLKDILSYSKEEDIDGTTL